MNWARNAITVWIFTLSSLKGNSGKALENEACAGQATWDLKDVKEKIENSEVPAHTGPHVWDQLFQHWKDAWLTLSLALLQPSL